MKKYYFACPSCGNDKEFYRIRETSARETGCLILLLGGILPLALFCGYKLGRIQCAKCGYIFRQPSPPSSPVAKAVLSFGILLPFLSILVGYVITTIPSLKESIPGSKIILWLEVILRKHTVGVAGILFTYIILTIIFSILIAVIANFKYRRPLLRKFDYKPFNKNHDNTDLKNNQN